MCGLTMSNRVVYYTLKKSHPHNATWSLFFCDDLIKSQKSELLFSKAGPVSRIVSINTTHVSFIGKKEEEILIYCDDDI